MAEWRTRTWRSERARRVRELAVEITRDERDQEASHMGGLPSHNTRSTVGNDETTILKKARGKAERSQSGSPAISGLQTQATSKPKDWLIRAHCPIPQAMMPHDAGRRETGPNIGRTLVKLLPLTSPKRITERQAQVGSGRPSGVVLTSGGLPVPARTVPKVVKACQRRETLTGSIGSISKARLRRALPFNFKGSTPLGLRWRLVLDRFRHHAWS